MFICCARRWGGLTGHRFCDFFPVQHCGQPSLHRVCVKISRSQSAKIPGKSGECGFYIPLRRSAVWVADITYVETAEGWLYVAGVLDRCTRRCVGWAMDDTLATTLPLAALDMALKQRRPTSGLVHHSDRGVQYASQAYRQRLAQAGVIPSMSRPGNCYDNAAMESFWSSLKRELVHRCQFATRAEARTAIFEWIEVFYNRERFHSALGFKSPVDFETQLN